MKRKISSTVSNVLWQIYGSKDSPCFDCFFFLYCFYYMFSYMSLFFHYASRSLLCQKVRKKFSFSHLLRVGFMKFCLWLYAFGILQVGLISVCYYLFFLFPYNYSSVVVICSLVSSIFALFCCIELAIRGKLDWFVSIQWCMFCLFFFLFISSSVNTNTDYI